MLEFFFPPVPFPYSVSVQQLRPPQKNTSEAEILKTQQSGKLRPTLL